MLRPILILSLVLARISGVGATHLTDERLQKVWDVMNQISEYSWENGTKAQAILEWNYPSLSVFGTDSPFPISSSLQTDDFSYVFDIARTTMQNRPASNPDLVDSQTNGSSLLEDGSSGDPASLGIPIILANISTDNAQVKGIGYGDAAREELMYLLHQVPRTEDGAISHRADQSQLWSDSVFMVPPFLAYYAVVTNNQSLLQEAYLQCARYHGHMATDSGLWKHIIFGDQFLDPGLWATGNAWAAYGMLRVLATIKKSPYAGDMQQQQVDLQTWTEDIMKATNEHIDKSGLLHNYIDNSSTFEDASATALMAAAALRLSTLGLTNDHVTMGTKLLSAASSKVNSTGYITQVTNPLSFVDQGTYSPEGQSFIIMAYAAFNQWNESGRPGAEDDKDPLGKYSGATRLGVPTWLAVGVSALSAVLSWSML